MLGLEQVATAPSLASVHLQNHSGLFYKRLATRHWFALDPSVLIPDLAHIMVSHHSSLEYAALQLCSKMFDLPAFFFLMCIHPGPCMIFSSENSFVALSVNK